MRDHRDWTELIRATHRHLGTAAAAIERATLTGAHNTARPPIRGQRVRGARKIARPVEAAIVAREDLILTAMAAYADATNAITRLHARIVHGITEPTPNRPLDLVAHPPTIQRAAIWSANVHGHAAALVEELDNERWLGGHDDDVVQMWTGLLRDIVRDDLERRLLHRALDFTHPGRRPAQKPLVHCTNHPDRLAKYPRMRLCGSCYEKQRRAG